MGLRQNYLEKNSVQSIYFSGTQTHVLLCLPAWFEIAYLDVLDLLRTLSSNPLSSGLKTRSSGCWASHLPQKTWYWVLNIFRGKRAFKVLQISINQSNKASLTAGMVVLLPAPGLRYLDFDGPTLISLVLSVFNSC